MKLAEAKKLVKSYGYTLVYDKDWEEYIIRRGKASYHTSDLDDAIGTAKFEFERQSKQFKREGNPSTSFLSDPEGITIRLIKGSGEQLKKILGRSFRVSSTKGKRKNPSYTSPHNYPPGYKLPKVKQTYDVLYDDDSGITRVYTMYHTTKAKAQKSVKQARSRGYKNVIIHKS